MQAGSTLRLAFSLYWKASAYCIVTVNAWAIANVTVIVCALLPLFTASVEDV